MATQTVIAESQELESRANELIDAIRNDSGLHPRYDSELRRLTRVAQLLSKLPSMETRVSNKKALLLVPTDQLGSLLAAAERVHSVVQSRPARSISEFAQARLELTYELRKTLEAVRERMPAGDSIPELNNMLWGLANDLADEVLTDAVLVSQAKTEQQETAGEVAESELAKEFAAYGDRQQRTGYIWLAVAIVLFGAAVAVAMTLLRQTGQAFDWYSFTTRLLIALPCFGLGAYCSRESSRHRELAQWARRIAVQLKSVGAYSARLDEVSRLTLLAQFGSYVFGPHQPGKDDNQVQPIPPELWKALADVIRSRGDARA